MAYPNGTPGSGVSDIYTGTVFTALNNVRSIRDGYTSLDRASIQNSLGTELALVQNFVNATYLGRPTTPVTNIYGSFISGVWLVAPVISGVTKTHTNYLKQNTGTTLYINPRGRNNRRIDINTDLMYTWTDSYGLYAYSGCTIRSEASGAHVNIYTFNKNSSVYIYSTNTDASIGMYTTGTRSYMNIYTAGTDSNLNLYSTGSNSHVDLYVSGAGSYITLSANATTSAGVNVISRGGSINIWSKSTGGNISIKSDGNANYYELITYGPIYTTANGFDIGFWAKSGGNVIISGTYIQLDRLPTGSPGGVGRLWNNGGVLNIT